MSPMDTKLKNHYYPDLATLKRIGTIKRMKVYLLQCLDNFLLNFLLSFLLWSCKPK